MYSFNKPIGTYGESLSEEFLISKGHTIITKNFRCRGGEIDIISSNNNYICFTEVKTRYTHAFGIPCESVTPTKIRKIRNTAKFYIYINNLFKNNFKFNVIEILLDSHTNAYSINFIENAF
ncbi:hypothetical protein Z968_02555 [Clostridium novyi A str. 4552]|uniref:UPF0102 protein Z968_02555 n=1 Tax=Clostridium novyi A str. 4552 TaxID=1444289 RepID=A0A0A0IDU1_CLONO|nr:YraN family protein [Clostridium novyi]KGM97745.1 hypothetical protein Z968_02555 [Clostridium novyi A str. 4552]